jgi:hypothetical protein
MEGYPHQHPQVPWVRYAVGADGSWEAYDMRWGRAGHGQGAAQLHQFAAFCANPPGTTGAGDVVKKITNAFGIEQCAPCAARQAALNRLTTRWFR